MLGDATDFRAGFEAQSCSLERLDTFWNYPAKRASSRRQHAEPASTVVFANPVVISSSTFNFNVLVG
ncbi:hypothetical protein Q8F57_043990 [Paraburkholderia terrae]|uniref:hypothetical protein n=1 Tax=Paraburkholderia terrae TaxID=311230 RepID=UPI00296B448A|nr:hypothetical protein [Paraburkholderia terrae]MDW3661897.1 hypothetical protein [Paraburkholderia terrae]